MLNIIIQGIISLFLVFIMGFIAYSIYNNEYVEKIGKLIMDTNKKEVPIFKGRFEFGSTEIKIETYNPEYLGYLNINPSKNQNGGAEYSYNFWLFYHLDSTSNKIYNTTSNEKTDYIILFFKGSCEKTMLYNTNNYECQEKLGDKKFLIKNPLVKLRNDGKELLVEYNNINFPDTYNNNAKPITNCTSLLNDYKTRRNSTNENINNLLSSNKFGIKNIDTTYYNDKFNMITIIFQENPSNEEVFNNNNANYRIYLNGELIEDRLANTNNIENISSDNYFKSRVIKNNNNKLNINPLKYDNVTYDQNNQESYVNSALQDVYVDGGLTKFKPLQLADFTYFNYALSTSEINNLYKKGFKSELAIIKTDNTLSNSEYAEKYIKYPTRELSEAI